MWRRRRVEDLAELPIQRWAGEPHRDDAPKGESTDWARELLKQREEREAEQEKPEEDLPTELRQFLDGRR